MNTTDIAFLTQLFETAVAAADPARALQGHLPDKPAGRTIVIGAGKGAAQLAQAFEEAWEDPVEGVVVTRYGYAAPCRYLKVLEASHPVPDAAGEAATQEVLSLLEGLTPDDLVVALITGGGSALLAAPPQGLELAAAPARVVSLVVSDVPGDDPAEVASGPTVPGPANRATALAAIRAWNIDLPPAVRRFLETAEEDAPPPDDPAFARNSVQVIASAARSLEAAADLAVSQGIPAHILSDAMEGEARDVARAHAAIAREVSLRNRPFARAFADGTTCAAMRAAGIDPAEALARNDAYTAFKAAGLLFTPGPTGTNVNDFRAILVR